MRRRATHRVQRDVEEFHRAIGAPVGETPAIRRPELRAALILEEAAEVASAILGREVAFTLGGAGEQSLVAAIDGLCDLVCVAYGTAVEFGIDLAPFWEEVHRSNLAKAGGPVRADGKALKPPGWRPPDIAGVLAGVERGAS
jgi:predicted HAD superfamily Cof-like phosphohydrolase